MNSYTLEHFRQRINRCRELASKTKDPEAKASLRAMVESLQEEIDRLEAKAAGAPDTRRRKAQKR